MQNIGHISGINAFKPGANDSGQAVAVEEKEAVKEKEVNKGWIINPFVDYFFVCGGALWLLYGATQMGVQMGGVSPINQAYGSILYWGALIFGDAHGPASMVRVFGSKTTPSKVRWVVIAWAIILIVVSCFSVYNRNIAQIFVAVTRLWAVQHYIAQTFGITLIYCMKRDYKLSSFERLVFQWLMRTMMFFIFVNFFTFPEYGHVQDFMGMELPFYGPLPPIFHTFTEVAFSLCAIVFTALVLIHLIFKKQFFPLPALAAIFSVAAVTMSPRNGFYMLGVTFLHGSQYVAITLSYFLKERSLAKTGLVPTNVVPKLISWWTAGWFCLITALGYLGAITLPVLCIKIGYPDALVLCTFYGLLSCHHFFTDAFIWRIRDPQVRNLLV